MQGAQMLQRAIELVLVVVMMVMVMVSCAL
jgi:hypothetical protein